jgi:hypothetical protein
MVYTILTKCFTDYFNIFKCFNVCFRIIQYILVHLLVLIISKYNVFHFLQLLSETFLILRSIQRDIIINVHISVFIQSTRYSCQIFRKL